MHEGQRVSVGEGAEETPSLSFARARSLLCASDLHGTVAKSRFRRSGRRGEKPDANRKQKQDIQENRLLGHLRRHGPYDSRTERERQQRLRMLLSFGIVKGSTVKNLHLEDGSTTNATGDAAGIVSLLRGNSRLGLGLAERRHSSTSQWRSPCSAGRQATGWVYMVSLMRSTASTRRSSGVVSEMRT